MGHQNRKITTNVNNYDFPVKCQFCALAYNLCNRVGHPYKNCGFTRDVYVSPTTAEPVIGVTGKSFGGRAFGRRV